MAKLKKGILGPIAGNLGPVTGSSWLGIPYVRQRAEKKENPVPRSVAQIANEQKMKFVNILLMPFHPYVTVGFNNLAIQKTAISVAYSINFHNAITGVYPNLGVDYSKIMISKGNLPGLVSPQMSLVEADKLKVDWENNPDPVAAYDDMIMLLLYCPELHLSDGFIGGIKRTVKTVVYTFNSSLIGKSLEVYIGVFSMNMKKIADSIYMGRITP